jgi:hypothetical protein
VRRFGKSSQSGKGPKRRKEESTFRESYDNSNLWDNLKKKKESKEDKDV